MSGLFLNQVSQEDLEYDGFFDGQNKIIPEGTELNAIVTGAGEALIARIKAGQEEKIHG